MTTKDCTLLTIYIRPVAYSNTDFAENLKSHGKRSSQSDLMGLGKKLSFQQFKVNTVNPGPGSYSNELNGSLE